MEERDEVVHGINMMLSMEQTKHLRPHFITVKKAD